MDHSYPNTSSDVRDAERGKCQTNQAHVLYLIVRTRVQSGSNLNRLVGLKSENVESHLSYA